MAELGGFAEPGFGPVADALASTFDQGDLGAGCVLYVGGRAVVDLWGGVADKATGRVWDRDTLTLVFSVTKGVSAICAHMLVERGDLDLDAHVTTYWPEFGAQGKEATTVRDVLSHRTGLPVVDGPVSLADLADPAGMAARMAAQAPLFEPGKEHVYQALTFSWNFGEIVRRITGQTLATFVARELAAPLGLDLYIGLPPELEARVSTLEPPNAPPELVALVLPEGSVPWRAITLNGLLSVTMAGSGLGFNSAEVHQLQLPAANGITNARSLASLRSHHRRRRRHPAPTSRNRGGCVSRPLGGQALGRAVRWTHLGHRLPPAFSTAAHVGRRLLRPRRGRWLHRLRRA